MNRCLCCDSNDYHIWDKENGYSLLKCNNCGALFIESKPKVYDREEALRLGVHMGDAELNVNTPVNTAKIPHYQKTLASIFGEKAPVTSWLDIGAGNGEFVETIRRKWPEITIEAVEPNSVKQKSCLLSKIKVYKLLSEVVDKYNAISLLNVWSHLPDPKSFMEEIVDKLYPGGLILIQTGNGASVTRREFPGYLYLPDHINFMSPNLVERIMNPLGFELIELRTYKYPRKRGIIFIAKIFAKWLLGRQKHPWGYMGGRYRDCWMLFRQNSLS
jgi:SAM-dependent methyltransferase